MHDCQRSVGAIGRRGARPSIWRCVAGWFMRGMWHWLPPFVRSGAVGNDKHSWNFGAVSMPSCIRLLWPPDASCRCFDLRRVRGRVRPRCGLQLVATRTAPTRRLYLADAQPRCQQPHVCVWPCRQDVGGSYDAHLVQNCLRCVLQHRVRRRA